MSAVCDRNEGSWIGIKAAMQLTGYGVARLQRLALDGRIATTTAAGYSGRLYRKIDLETIATATRELVAG